LWHWLSWFMRKNYAKCVEWTKLSEIENRSLSIWLLHAVESVKLKLCIKFVHNDCMLKNECSCHSKLLQKFRFYHHYRCRLKTLRDCDDDLIVHEVNVLQYARSKMCSIWAVHQNMLDCLIISFAIALKTIRAQYVS